VTVRKATLCARESRRTPRDFQGRWRNPDRSVGSWAVRVSATSTLQRRLERHQDISGPTDSRPPTFNVYQGGLAGDLHQRSPSHSSECTTQTVPPSVPLYCHRSQHVAIGFWHPKQLEKLDPSDAKYRPLLHELLSRQDLRPYVQSLHGSDLEGFVELLDKVGRTDPTSTVVDLTTRLGAQPHPNHRRSLPEGLTETPEHLQQPGGFATIPPHPERKPFEQGGRQ
jgi:hypothetical protein